MGDGKLNRFKVEETMARDAMDCLADLAEQLGQPYSRHDIQIIGIYASDDEAQASVATADTPNNVVTFTQDKPAPSGA